MVADGAGGAGGGDGAAGEVAGSLGRAAPAAGAGAAGEDVALDANDGGDEGGPFGVGEGVGGVEDGDAAILLPVAPTITAADVGERRGGGAEVLRLLMQSRLVVLELDDQVELGVSGGLECFFDSAGRRA